MQVLWECGGTLAAPAITGGVIHKAMAFIAPKLVGGVTAPTPVGELGNVEMTQVRVHDTAQGSVSRTCCCWWAACWNAQSTQRTSASVGMCLFDYSLRVQQLVETHWTPIGPDVLHGRSAY